MYVVDRQASIDDDIFYAVAFHKSFLHIHYGLVQHSVALLTPERTGGRHEGEDLHHECASQAEGKTGEMASPELSVLSA